MITPLSNYDFPRQKIPASEKDKVWAAQCCDYVIAQGLACKDEKRLNQLYEIMAGNIPEEFYKKILNPYNATNEKYKKFPAVMRNYDLMKGIIRRYVGEYLKNPHIFIVGANNPDVMLARDQKLKAELTVLVQNAVAQRITEAYEQFVNEGNNPKEFKPQQVLNIEQFVKDFNDNYVDDISAQGQELLNVIRDITEDELLYEQVYFNFISYGQTYDYTDVNGSTLVKECIKPIDAYPVPTDAFFVEDDEMFACRRKMTYSQIMDNYDRYFDDKDREYLETYYAKFGTPGAVDLTFGAYYNYYADICGKFNKTDRELFKNGAKDIISREANDGLFDVWHAVWRSYSRRAIVTYVNEIGMVTTRYEEDGYKMNPEAGDIDIEWIYVPQVYESVRIGGRNDAIYPYGARAIAYDRKGKLPYNGLTELFPGYGRFSIIEEVLPYQIFYNIVAYAREMAMARNKLTMLLIPKSLLGKTPKDQEETIYRALAEGTLYIDDENDAAMLRTQNIRMLVADISAYIKQLSELLQEIDYAAKQKVDMTPQRYGEIANTAGKGTTEEAIARGSMGSVIVEYMIDMLRERDYARDLDFSKLAWIDGLNTSYRDENDNNKIKYVSLNVNEHIFADYIVKAKNSSKEREKLEQLKQFAFNASQNGDLKSALAAIKGDNVAEITKLMNKFTEEARAHEEQIKQMDLQLEQMKEEHDLQLIAAKGEQERLNIELEGEIKKNIELIRADANMISYNANVSDTEQNAGIARLNEARAENERQRLELDRQKVQLDTALKLRDQQLKDKQIEAQLTIARENKNKYDKGGKGTKK